MVEELLTDLKLMLGLIEEFQIVRVSDRNYFECVMRAVGTTTDVQDSAIRAFAERPQDLERANFHTHHRSSAALCGNVAAERL